MLDAASLRLVKADTPNEVISGRPISGIREVLDGPGLNVGVWELTPGTVHDTEADEVFIVLSGSATIEVEGEDRVLQLTRGTVGRLAAGTRTRWTVFETIRTVYVSSAER